MIKRPLVWLLGSYLAGMLLAWFKIHLLSVVSIIILYFSILLLLLYHCKNKYINKKDSFLWSLPILLFLGFYGMGLRMKPADVDIAFEYETPCTLNGEITMVVKKQWGMVLYVKDNKIKLSDSNSYTNYVNSSSDSFLIENTIIYCSNEQNYRTGNKITVTGKLQKFSTATNPGQFNERMYYKIQNIDYKIWADEITIIDADFSPLHYYLDRIKERFQGVYEKILPKKEAGAINAMLLGDKYLLDEEIKELYQENGISHILAISGLHVSLIGAAVYILLRKLRSGLIPATVLSILFVYGYGVLTNFTVSTNRAVVMFIIMLLARIFGKTYDMLSALSLSALLILLQNPLQIFHAGFLLSFGAVLGLAVLLPCFQVLIPVRHPILDAILVSISAQLMTIPLIMVFFYQIPIYSIFINLLILPTSSVLILSALVAGIVGILSLPLGVFFIGGTNYILKLYEWLCRIGAGLPRNLYTTGKPDNLRILIFLLLLTVFIWGSHKFKKSYLLSLPVLAIFLLIHPNSIGDFTVTMLDVGQGEAIFMESKNGITYLIDGGSADVKRVGKNRIQPFLLYNGVDQIDYAIVTHGDQDHISGLVELMEGGKIAIKNLILPLIKIDDEMYDSKTKQTTGELKVEQAIVDKKVPLTKKEKAVLSYIKLEAIARKNAITVLYIKAGDIIKDGELLIECLHPAKDYQYSSSNSYSTVLSISYRDFDMLLTGDIEKDGDKLLMERLQADYDILKVAHHGSRNSTGEEFLANIKPKLSLISCGKDNRYGHPHEELLERLDDIGSEVFMTFESGAIMIVTGGNTMKIYKYRAGLR